MAPKGSTVQRVQSKSRAILRQSARMLKFTTWGGGPGRCGQVTAIPEKGVPSLREQLAGLGAAGVVAYGILNTAYYTAAFYLIWCHVARVPRGLGIVATAKKCAEVAALTWAGSQATKLPRAAGAMLLAPLVDTGAVVLQQSLGLRRRRTAYALVVAGCLLGAAAFYGFVILSWA